MAENKKSFVLYCDIIHTIEKLTDEQSGRLFKHILRYVNDENPQCDDVLIDVVFEPIKQSLKRDLRKFEQIKDARSKAGKEGASKRWQKMANAKNSMAKNGKPKQAITTMADSVSVSVSDSVINKKDKNEYRAFSHLSISQTHFDLLVDDGYTQKQIDSVLDEIENFAGNKKYKSLYLTAKNWLARKYPKPNQVVKTDFAQSIQSGIIKISKDVD